MNVNHPSTSKKRLSDDHGVGNAKDPITEFRGSETTNVSSPMIHQQTKQQVEAIPYFPLGFTFEA